MELVPGRSAGDDEGLHRASTAIQEDSGNGCLPPTTPATRLPEGLQSGRLGEVLDIDGDPDLFGVAEKFALS